jgi:polar amino acid transport system substrate-binding protein
MLAMSLTQQAGAISLTLDIDRSTSVANKLGHSMLVKRTLAVVAAGGLALTLVACGSSSSSGGSGTNFGDCKVTSKKNSISIKPVTAGTLTVETTLPAQGWWNGTTPSSIKSGYEYCMAADLANMAGLTSVTVKNVSFDQLVAGRTNSFDIALAEISITSERAKVVDFSTPYFDSNIGVLTKTDAGVTADNINSKSCAAYAGTTSVPFMQDKLKCHSRVYPNSQTLYQGVLSGQVDVAFLDTAIVLAEAKATGGKLAVVGQYKTGEKYGAIYPKGSANEKGLDQGIQTLIKDGTTNQLSKDYLGPAFGGNPSSVPVWTIK